ncbi:hypothetical protein [Fischerella sp. PCC 9605]|uniref:hypothetical protein n=1 Tax=Fischerella sp. PCC 9605 TaxID=1173024 RepID=UPI00047D7549|nr:hypothetical protein [Fischerella sp. PCC 9605]
MNFINQIDEFPYQVTLFLLGCQILIRCKYKVCLDGIAATFSPVVCIPSHTPDVVIDCDWEKAGRYLFRTRPPEDTEPLFGVQVHTQGKLAESDWPFLEPPIPPLVVEPFRNRFIGLHAGSVQTSSGKCLIFLGNRGSGKTTTTLALVNNHKCSLLTDETVFIHRRTKLVEPFPRSVHLRETHNGSLRKVSVSADKACQVVADKPALATHIIFLEPDEKVQEQEFSSLTPAEAFRNFLKHHLNAGCCPDESMVTLFKLACEVPAFMYRYTTYEDLLSLPEKCLEIC